MRDVMVYGIMLVAIALMVIAGASALNPGTSAEAGSDVVSAPEFPSAFIPVTMIVGFFGIVGFVRKAGEN